MPDAIMYDEDMFVVLETNQPEVFLTPEELHQKLKTELATLQDQLPASLQKLESMDEQAQKLIDTDCELDLGPDKFLKWYAVRLDK